MLAPWNVSVIVPCATTPTMAQVEQASEPKSGHLQHIYGKGVKPFGKSYPTNVCR